MGLDGIGAKIAGLAKAAAKGAAGETSKPAQEEGASASPPPEAALANAEEGAENVQHDSVVGQMRENAANDDERAEADRVADTAQQHVDAVRETALDGGTNVDGAVEDDNENRDHDVSDKYHADENYRDVGDMTHTERAATSEALHAAFLEVESVDDMLTEGREDNPDTEVDERFEEMSTAEKVLYGQTLEDQAALLNEELYVISETDSGQVDVGFTSDEIDNPDGYHHDGRISHDDSARGTYNREQLEEIDANLDAVYASFTEEDMQWLADNNSYEVLDPETGETTAMPIADSYKGYIAEHSGQALPEPSANAGAETTVVGLDAGDGSTTTGSGTTGDDGAVPEAPPATPVVAEPTSFAGYGMEGEGGGHYEDPTDDQLLDAAVANGFITEEARANASFNEAGEMVYTVQPGDGYWNIAEEVYPDVQASNTQAFVGGWQTMWSENAQRLGRTDQTDLLFVNDQVIVPSRSRDEIALATGTGPTWVTDPLPEGSPTGDPGTSGNGTGSTDDIPVPEGSQESNVSDVDLNGDGTYDDGEVFSAVELPANTTTGFQWEGPGSEQGGGTISRLITSDGAGWTEGMGVPQDAPSMVVVADGQTYTQDTAPPEVAAQLASGEAGMYYVNPTDAEYVAVQTDPNDPFSVNFVTPEEFDTTYDSRENADNYGGDYTGGGEPSTDTTTTGTTVPTDSTPATTVPTDTTGTPTSTVPESTSGTTPSGDAVYAGTEATGASATAAVLPTDDPTYVAIDLNGSGAADLGGDTNGDGVADPMEDLPGVVVAPGQGVTLPASGAAAVVAPAPAGATAPSVIETVAGDVTFANPTGEPIVMFTDENDAVFWRRQQPAGS